MLSKAHAAGAGAAWALQGSGPRTWREERVEAKGRGMARPRGPALGSACPLPKCTGGHDGAKVARPKGKKVCPSEIWCREAAGASWSMRASLVCQVWVSYYLLTVDKAALRLQDECEGLPLFWENTKNCKRKKCA